MSMAVSKQYDITVGCKYEDDPVHLDFKRIAEDQWDHDPRLHKVFHDFDSYYRMYRDTVMDSRRIEYTVYDNGRLVAGLILSPMLDYHYGSVVCPQVCRVITGQNSRALSRIISACFKDACKRYCIPNYQTMQHTGPTTHTIKTHTGHY